MKNEKLMSDGRSSSGIEWSVFAMRVHTRHTHAHTND